MPVWLVYRKLIFIKWKSFKITLVSSDSYFIKYILSWRSLFLRFRSSADKYSAPSRKFSDFRIGVRLSSDLRLVLPFVFGVSDIRVGLAGLSDVFSSVSGMAENLILCFKLFIFLCEFFPANKLITLSNLSNCQQFQKISQFLFWKLVLKFLFLSNFQ